MDLTHTQLRTTAGALYRVQDEVTAATDIPAEVFVLSTETQAYSRVATVDDLFNLPVGRDAALAAQAAYYREDVVQRDFEFLSTANEFAASLKRDLKYLVVEYNKAVTLFLGTESETYTP